MVDLPRLWGVVLGESMTLFVKIYNYAGKYEHIRRDQIQSVCEPGSGVHDNGSVVLTTGRIISFGHPTGPRQLMDDLRQLNELERLSQGKV